MKPIDEFSRYDIEQAMQSNFRTLSLLTDEIGGSLAHLFFELKEQVPDNCRAKATLDRMAYKMVEILSQATYTGRCLGGVLTPNKSLPTDQRQFSKEMLEFIAAVSAMQSSPKQTG